MELIYQKLTQLNWVEEVLILSSLKHEFDGLAFESNLLTFHLTGFSPEYVKYLGNYSAFCILRSYFPELKSEDLKVNTDPLFDEMLE